MLSYMNLSVEILNSGITVNQLLFREVSDIHWCTTTNFRDQDADYLENNISETFKDRFKTRNIPDEALAKLMKISRT